MTLEELIRDAAAKGMTHFSVWPVHSQDRKTIYWTARCSPSTEHKFVEHHDTDIVRAVSEVFKNLPRAKRKVTAKVKHTAERGLEIIDPLDAKPPEDEWAKFK